LVLILVENQTSLSVDDEGRYKIHNVEEGEYHLDVLFNQKVLKRQVIKVPSANYDIHV